MSQVEDFLKRHFGMTARTAQNSGSPSTNPATHLTGANDLATLLANSGADMQTRLASVRAIEASIVGTTIEERVAAASRLWKVVAGLGTVVGGAAGVWFQSDRAKPAPEPVVVSTSSLPEKEKTTLRLELAQDCLNAGNLDCADQLADPVLRTDSSNAVAQKIKTDVKNKQAQLPVAAQGDGKQSRQMLLSLAAGNVSLANSCLAAGNIDCVATLSSLVLQTVPEGDSAGQQIRTEAESLQNRASQMSHGGMKTRHTPPPTIGIK